LPILSEAERHQLLVECNRTTADYPRLCAHEQFEEHVRRSPDAVAAVFEKQSWTYAELNRQAERIASCLRKAGACPGARVAICVERSLNMLAALLGIWKSGAAFVPLDPGYPPERLQSILDDAAPVVFITAKNIRGSLRSQAQAMFLEDLQTAQSDPAS